MNATDLGILDNPVCPVAARALAERRELLRRAYLSAIARADAGQPVDPIYIAQARCFVASNPALLVLGAGEPT